MILGSWFFRFALAYPLFLIALGHAIRVDPSSADVDHWLVFATSTASMAFTGRLYLRVDILGLGLLGGTL
jgi:hypothetical protein